MKKHDDEVLIDATQALFDVLTGICDHKPQIDRQAATDKLIKLGVKSLDELHRYVLEVVTKDMTATYRSYDPEKYWLVITDATQHSMPPGFWSTLNTLHDTVKHDLEALVFLWRLARD